MRNGAGLGSVLTLAATLIACDNDTPQPSPPDAKSVPTPDAGAASRTDAASPAATPARLFPEASLWYRDITAVPADLESPMMISALAASGGFGLGEMAVDFAFEVVTADDSAPMTQFAGGPDYFRPDCDEMPVPLMSGGALEGETGYECTQGGECHLLVHHLPTQRLYEMWKAHLAGGVLTAGCLAVWDTRRVYGPSGRGVNCASADAAGLPISPLLFTADEVAAGEIPHALRFALPTDRIRNGVYLAPATHSTRAATGGMAALPLGARLRLRRDYPVESLPARARVVARALTRYGMFLADGGMKALSARSDRSTRAKWGSGDTRLLGERDLAAIKITDLEVIDGGVRIPYRGDCIRAP